MSVVVRDGAAVERVAFQRIAIGPRVASLVEQVIGARDPEARCGTVRDLAFEDVTAPEDEPPASAWTWYTQFRPGLPPERADVPVFAGVDDAHAVDGLRLRSVVVRGRRLTSAAVAREIAGLTIGDHVRSVEID
jgi:hypothetical protein